jgi:polysaccharide export outer membrane protein
MRRRALAALVPTLAALAGIAPAPARAAEPYRLNPSDVLRISVWREEGLERELVVQPDGTISFPLAGQIAASGRTVGEIEQEVAARLERFIPGPVVTVELIEVRGNLVYVIGEVNNPGGQALTRPTTVMQALAIAGGFTPYAGRSRIRILRKDAAGVEQVLRFDYTDVAEGRAVATNVELKAGDVVVVPGGALF